MQNDLELAQKPATLTRSHSQPAPGHQPIGLHRLNPRLAPLKAVGTPELPKREVVKMHHPHPRHTSDDTSSNSGDSEHGHTTSPPSPGLSADRSRASRNAHTHSSSDAEDDAVSHHAEENSQRSYERKQESKWIQAQYAVPTQRNRVFEELIRGHVESFAKDKYTHFILTLVLQEGPLSHKQHVFDEVCQHKEALSLNQHGHKIFEMCLEASMTISPKHFYELAEFIVDEDCYRRHGLVYDIYGNYIVQKAIQIFPENLLQRLLLLIKRDLQHPFPKYDAEQKKHIAGIAICSTKYGSLIFQSIFDAYKMRQMRRQCRIRRVLEQIIDILASECLEFGKCQYSNYVIQQMLMRDVRPFKFTVINAYLDAEIFGKNASDSYASRVTEKCLEHASLKQINNLAAKVLQCPQQITQLINDRFANFVMQRLYEHSNFNCKREMYHILLQMKHDKTLNEFGARVISFMQKTHIPDLHLPNERSPCQNDATPINFLHQKIQRNHQYAIPCKTQRSHLNAYPLSNMNRNFFQIAQF